MNDIMLTTWLLILSLTVALSLLVVRKYYIDNKHVLAMAGKWATYLQSRSAESRRETKKTRLKQENKGVILETLGDEIPFGKNIINGLKQRGMSENDIFSLATDPEIINGLMVVSSAVGKITSPIIGRLQENGQEKSRKPPSSLKLASTS